MFKYDRNDAKYDNDTKRDVEDRLEATIEVVSEIMTMFHRYACEEGVSDEDATAYQCLLAKMAYWLK